MTHILFRSIAPAQAREVFLHPYPPVPPFPHKEGKGGSVCTEMEVCNENANNYLAPAGPLPYTFRHASHPLMPHPIADADFDAQVLQSDLPVLMDFWAPWCGPCKAMNPIIEELEKEYDGKVKVVKMNVDENIETPGTFGVMSIPTFILFKKGKPVSTFVGSRSKEDMKKEIENVL